jgi:hypothetical protein
MGWWKAASPEALSVISAPICAPCARSYRRSGAERGGRAAGPVEAEETSRNNWCPPLSLASRRCCRRFHGDGALHGEPASARPGALPDRHCAHIERDGHAAATLGDRPYPQHGMTPAFCIGPGTYDGRRNMGVARKGI